MMSFITKKKAVSPVIAIVLLIVLTVAAAATLWVLVDSLVDEDIEITINETAFYDIDGDLRYDQGVLQIFNTGSEDLILLSVTIQSEFEEKEVTWPFLEEYSLRADTDQFTSYVISTNTTSDELESGQTVTLSINYRGGGKSFATFSSSFDIDLKLLIKADGFDFLKRITIDANKVPEDLMDYPLLIKFDADPDLAVGAQTDADDIAFVAGNGITRLKHEIERYNSSTGELIAWVRIPNLSATIDTELFIVFGNPEAEGSTNPAQVWDDNYRAVWHLEEDPGTGLVSDSTQWGNDAIPIGTMDSADQINAQIGKGYDLDGADDYLQVCTPGNCQATSLAFTDNQYTLEAWARVPPGGTVNDEGIIDRFLNGNDERNYLGIEVRGGEQEDEINCRTTTDVTGHVRTDAGVNLGGVARGVWTYVACRYNGTAASGNLQGWVDGSKIVERDVVGNILSTVNDRVQLGKRYNARWYTGMYDELRISNIARPDGYFVVNFNNHIDPESFFSVSKLIINTNTHSLDGFNDWILVGDGSTTHFGTSQGTISFWVKFDLLPSVQKSRPWGQQGDFEIRADFDNKFWLDFGSDSTLESPNLLVNFKWYFVAITWDDVSNHLALYIGDEDNPPTVDVERFDWPDSVVTNTPIANGHNFMASRTQEPVDGHGDELRYYDVARNITELQSDYNKSLSGTEPGLRSYFPFNGDLIDIGPDKVNGSFVGSNIDFSSDTPVWTLTVVSLKVNDQAPIITLNPNPQMAVYQNTKVMNNDD